MLNAQQKQSRATAEEASRMKAVRTVQWRTRFGACERKLIELKNYLRYCPNDVDACREAEAVEQMYKELLNEAS